MSEPGSEYSSLTYLLFTSGSQSQESWHKGRGKGAKMACFEMVDELRGYTKTQFRINTDYLEL